ncbi:AMP-binding protein [Hirschia baltica]|uniref:AMP-dependent synthetase and ligase n=1 Tax=Hirschia baltica (strain ATCC 49814 / DSM 5838 / IFAM 1418) TaxID=582402 RepID=C6XPJ9_HIRBI|nr:AMP-binding protein [Hirschia baltica]ACT60264.1 AMP-dependent synthetase and ligase [Hirschia baltica ATCC 49814]
MKFQEHNDILNPFLGWDVRSLLERQAKIHADKTFLVWEPFEGVSEEWSYSRFVERIGRFAAGLYDKGIVKGDKVIIHMDNCPEQLIAWLGCAWLGAVAVTTNAKSSCDELTYFCEKSRARAAVTQIEYVDLLSQSFPGAEWIAVVGAENEKLSDIQRVDSVAFEDICGDIVGLPAHVPDCFAPFGVQFTSGTTSRPKGVVWTHANALWGGKMSALHEGLTEDDTFLVFMPLFHTNAQVYSVLSSLWVGATVVLQPRFSASRFWSVALKHRCTWASMVPFIVQALLKQEVPEEHWFRFWGNAICDIPTDAHFGVRTIGWWGMTETVTHGIVGSVHFFDRPMSMGRPSPGYGVGVFDDSGMPVSAGGTGNLVVRGVRGVSLFLEYLDDEEATAASFDEHGWFVTGDRVTVSGDGWLIFADRAKDMLKVGGENVAASEVEHVIASLPGVLEVAVVARPDPMLDEVPVAFIRIFENSNVEGAALRELVFSICREKLSDFKVPQDIIFVDDFPRSTLNKIAKAELRKMAAN